VISFLEGTLVAGGPEAVVAIAGCGLSVHLSTRAAAQLPPVGQTVKLWTQLIVREDEWLLCGFLEPGERAMFKLLLSVAGVGPKLALGLLSAAAPAEIAAHLRAGDEKALARLPGIGRKSAARLIVELGQRLPAELADRAGGDGSPTRPAADGELSEPLAVLTSMGLGSGQAEQALRRARTEDASVVESVERWVRAALQRL
jgi:Holliday junction DNA helicase RuvA